MSEPQFIPSGLPLRVEIPEGGHDATSRSSHAGAAIRHAPTDPVRLAQAGADADRQHLAFEHSAAAQPALLTDVASPLKVQPPLAQAGTQPSALADSTTQTLAALASPPELSHFMARVQQLRADNDKVREQLERLETPSPGIIRPASPLDR